MSEWLAAAGGASWAIIGILGALFSVFITIRKGWGPFRDVISWGEQLNELVTGQDEISKVVKRELMPNGGGSLVDRVSRIDTHVQGLHERMQRVEEVLPGAGGK